EDPVDYPADGGDDGDDEKESSEDDEEDEDDDMDVEADEEEEEEHPAPADSVVVAPTAADQAPSAKETEPFETDESAATPPPHPAYHTTTRISILAPVPMPSWTDSEVVRLLAISSPPASPLSSWKDCPERNNQNHENQIKSTKARGVVHAFGGGETEQDLNNIEDEIEA
nr:hypothetical protein [Tanacetum cinerariifolium]